MKRDKIFYKERRITIIIWGLTYFDLSLHPITKARNF